MLSNGSSQLRIVPAAVYLAKVEGRTGLAGLLGLSSTPNFGKGVAQDQAANVVSGLRKARSAPERA